MKGNEYESLLNPDLLITDSNNNYKEKVNLETLEIT